MANKTKGGKGKRTGDGGGYAVEMLRWTPGGAPIWDELSKHANPKLAKAAMDDAHRQRKDVSLRIIHDSKKVASTTTGTDVALMRKAKAEGKVSATPEAEGQATKADAKAKPAQAAARKRAPRASKAEGKMSALDAAAKVLVEAEQPLNCKEMIAAMADKKYWTSPGGKTPHATLYSAILRELTTKGKDARFKKTERGKFAAK